MILTANTKRSIVNEKASLTLDSYGGAITSFHLNDQINPLSFSVSKSQMPENNQNGAPYQGHFLCLGRWGEPSAGEVKAGIPNHGQIANMKWEIDEDGIDNRIKMQVVSPLEGLEVKRTIDMDKNEPVYAVREVVKNINPLGRLYNMVQHPTLGHPFLDHSTVINCNADRGYNYVFSEDPAMHVSFWPIGECEDKSIVDLSRPEKAYSSVFPFIVKKGNKLGWITAYSPKFNVLFGYIWRRKEYPWINLWLDWSADQIRYRGLEFGTTGIHKPFHQIIEEGNISVFGEKTFEFIDAGEKVSRSYLSFLHKVESGFKGVEDIRLENDHILIKAIENDREINIKTSLKLLV